jgi:MFS family permease
MRERGDNAAAARWSILVKSGPFGAFAIILGGILLHALNSLITDTLLPSAAAEIGGVALLSWPAAAYMAAAIVAAAGAATMGAWLGARRSFRTAAIVFALGSVLCGAAPTMAVLVGGCLVQGLGGGVLSALAYVMVRSLYPAALWPRAFAFLSGVWGVSVLIGPLVGGYFAGLGLWRGAFFVMAALAAALAGLARALPPPAAAAATAVAMPVGRLSLVALGIGSMSMAAVATTPAARAVLIGLALLLLVRVAGLDRRAAAPLLPREAFSLRTAVGAGLWMILLLSVANDPFPIYGPLFLQRLHGLSPLAAGYLVAGEAMSWTVTAIVVAALPRRQVPVILAGGPLVMALGLTGISAAMPRGSLAALFLPVYLAGGGIGAAWAFIAQAVMSAAPAEEEARAAAAVPTLQQIGLALGAALAGLVANLAGLEAGEDGASLRRAAQWVPGVFALIAIVAAAAGARLSALLRRER